MRVERSNFMQATFDIEISRYLENDEVLKR